MKNSECGNKDREKEIGKGSPNGLSAIGRNLSRRLIPKSPGRAVSLDRGPGEIHELESGGGQTSGGLGELWPGGANIWALAHSECRGAR